MQNQPFLCEERKKKQHGRMILEEYVIPRRKNILVHIFSKLLLSCGVGKKNSHVIFHSLFELLAIKT